MVPFTPEAKPVGWPDLKALPTNFFLDECIMNIRTDHTQIHTHTNILIHLYGCTNVITIYILTYLYIHALVHSCAYVYAHVIIPTHTPSQLY